MSQGLDIFYISVKLNNILKSLRATAYGKELYVLFSKTSFISPNELSQKSPKSDDHNLHLFLHHVIIAYILLIELKLLGMYVFLS